MNRFQILCVTMNQIDFSKINEMNVNTNIIFANQANKTTYEKCTYKNHLAEMVTTTTRGVGKNRNIALLYANAEICLLSDDDMLYIDNLEDVILREFDRQKNADVIIFNITSDCEDRPEIQNTKMKKLHLYNRMPYGAVRIAFRLSKIKKANVSFSTLFGGGTVFPAGEDSIFLRSLMRAGLNVYVSDKNIGNVSFDTSTWFDGYNEKYFYGKGAFCSAVHPITKYIWLAYYLWRTKELSQLSSKNAWKWMRNGVKGYEILYSYEDWKNNS